MPYSKPSLQTRFQYKPPPTTRNLNPPPTTPPSSRALNPPPRFQTPNSPTPAPPHSTAPRFRALPSNKATSPATPIFSKPPISRRLPVVCWALCTKPAKISWCSRVTLMFRSSCREVSMVVVVRPPSGGRACRRRCWRATARQGWGGRCSHSLGG